jgi:hypothetical protein
MQAIPKAARRTGSVSRSRSGNVREVRPSKSQSPEAFEDLLQKIDSAEESENTDGWILKGFCLIGQMIKANGLGLDSLSLIFTDCREEDMRF